jgi:hypothetical protein
VREYCPSTTGPLLPTMTDSLLAPGHDASIQAVSVPKVPKPDQAAISACAKNQEGPKPGEHVQLFRMERDHNKGFYSEKR